MLAVIPEINWLAVIASTLVFAVLGGVYFTAVVGTPYRVALGNEDRELPRPGALFIVGPLVSSLLVVTTSAVLLRALDIDSAGDGVVFALVIAIGYLVAQTLTIAINPNFPRPLLYTLINAPYSEDQHERRRASLRDYVAAALSTQARYSRPIA